ncbi:hypothetical protein TDB9533_03379 [Thalassocella blandensis]|nr:hypothetical protein TDB9533_03379 [Thalassocella blandensis]
MPTFATSSKILAAFAMFCVLSACSSVDEFSASKTPKIKQTRDGTVNVSSRASGVKGGRIGTTTLLTLPIGSIKARGDTSAQIMQGVELALEAAGYNNPQTQTYSAEEAAYIKAHVEEIEMGNFLASSWATLVIQLRLETRDGGVLWNKRVRTSVNALNNYNRTATVAMNKLVKEMAQAFVEEDFFLATQRVKRHHDFLREPVSSAAPTPVSDNTVTSP